MSGNQSSSLPSAVRDLIARQPPGHSLLKSFHSDPEVYRPDLERVWRRGWLFVGHSCEVANAGDCISLTVDTDSILVVRGANGRADARRQAAHVYETYYGV